MIQGTTPTHIFTINFHPRLISKMEITYAQRNKVVCKKTLADIEVGGDNTYKVRLTQEETLKFDEKDPVFIQVRILTIDGEALASGIRKIDVDHILDKVVIE